MAWETGVCPQLAEVQFEFMRPGTHRYGPKTTLTEPTDLMAFCAAVRSSTKGAPDGPPRSKPWGWVGFLDKGARLLASATLQHESEPGYLMIAGGEARRLSAEETAALIQLMRARDKHAGKQP